MEEEHQKSRAELLEEAQIALAEYQALIKLPGWGRLAKLIEEQIQEREQAIHQPIFDVGQVLNQEFQKGEEQGMHNILLLPQQQVEELTGYIEVITRQIDTEEEQKNARENRPYAP